MVIDCPERTEPRKELWQLAFGDSEAFVNRFFADAYSPRRCRCAWEDGRLAAALYWFDAEFAGQKFAYLYAVATHPNFRHRGVCRALMADTLDCLTARGYDGALLMPQSGALREMYARMGFRDCCTVSEFTCEAEEAVPVRKITASEFARLRREYLPPDGALPEGAPPPHLGNAAAAPGILGALGFPRGRFRTPGGDLPGAMFRPLRENVKAPGYFGLVFE